MSDTPRTDAIHHAFNNHPGMGVDDIIEAYDFARELEPGALVLSFGWNTVGMGPGWTTDEIMLVCHGGDHNDTICMADRESNTQGELWKLT